MSRQISFRASDELDLKIQAEMKSRDLTITDVVLQAVEAHFNRDKRQQNFEELQRRLDQLEYETIRNRSLMIRVFDPERTTITEKLLEEAGKDASGYLEQRRRGKEE